MIPDWVRSSTTMKAALDAARRHFAYAAGFSALLNILFIVPMIYMLQVYDRVVPTQGRMTLLFLTIVLAVSLATLAALDAIRSRLLVRAGVQIDRMLAAPIIRSTLIQPDSAQRLARQAVREFDILRQAIHQPWGDVRVLVRREEESALRGPHRDLHHHEGLGHPQQRPERERWSLA